MAAITIDIFTIESMSEQINCVGCDESPGNISLHTSNLISKMFTECTGLKVHSTYTLCKSCQSELKSCYNFRKRCHEIFSLYHTEIDESPSPSQLETFAIPIEEVNHTIKSESDNLMEFEESYIEEEEFVHPDTTEEDDDDQSYNPNEDEIESKVEFFRCATCEKSFSKRSQLIAHEKTHVDLRIYECPRESCNSSFNVVARLIRHMKNVHAADDEEIVDVKEHAKSIRPVKVPIVKEKLPQGKVQCEICHKILSNARYLKEHMSLQHLKTTKYICKEKGCRKRFKIWSLLEKHMRKHNGFVDFTCKFCGKGYVQRKVYNQHLRKAHQISQTEIDQLRWSVNGCEVNDNRCKDCGKEFKTPHKLFEHRALDHGDGQRYICDMCGKAYTSKAFLLSHQKYHKGVKNKKCTRCPSTFTEHKGLLTHLRRVHKLTEEELLAITMDGKL